eukprot:PhF_6_TR14688/c0_g1_i1/m.23137
MPVSRPFFSLFAPATGPARLRGIAHRYRNVLFGLSVGAILATQINFRAHLDDEKEGTQDRIQRRVYVRLPDGRNAQVHPRVYTDMSIQGIWQMVKETLNPLP